MKKSRPCVVLSSDEMNAVLGTVIIAPMTSTIRGYPSRVEVRFQNKTAKFVWISYGLLTKTD